MSKDPHEFYGELPVGYTTPVEWGVLVLSDGSMMLEWLGSNQPETMLERFQMIWDWADPTPVGFYTAVALTDGEPDA